MRTRRKADRRPRPENDTIMRYLTHCASDDCGAGGTEPRSRNPFLADPGHTGRMTVRQLAELVLKSGEFPQGLDTVIKIGDVEGNNPTNGDITVTWHRPGDVVLSVDPNEGEGDYGAEAV